MESATGRPDTWDVLYEGKAENLGTNPHLGSKKFTGYGIVMRSAVDTPDEVSLHLQQIDQGPNYRWGRSADGGCGVIYYSAKGKAYSMNGAEDVGDRFNQDTDFATNFGVFWDGAFRSIGMNVLSQPFYDLSCGQFAELTSRNDAATYSAPAYQSRSVLMAGHDYFVIYDALLSSELTHRLSWFVRKGDELPTIKLVRGGNGDPRSTQRTEISTAATTGVWFDGTGDSMALVTHRKDLNVKTTPYGCSVEGPGVTDWVFRNPTAIHFEEGPLKFNGTAGLIRKRGDSMEFALFHGSSIAVEGLSISTEDSDLGISGSVIARKAIRGQYHAIKSSIVKFLAANLSEKARLYVDGEAQEINRSNRIFSVNLAAGKHFWELTETLPVPVAPAILRTENHSGGTTVLVGPVASATRYRIELSKDSGASWTSVATQPQVSIPINGIENGTKVHVRAVAMNNEHESLPGAEYPVYVTQASPPIPDGLLVKLEKGAATVTWGEVLGVSEYRLYARVKGTRDFQLLYRGLERTYVDRRPGIQAADAIPMRAPVLRRIEIVEYQVAAANKNGESVMSAVANTDPASWRNWDPMPGEPFRRVEGFDPATPPSASEFARYYPE